MFHYCFVVAGNQNQWRTDATSRGQAGRHQGEDPKSRSEPSSPVFPAPSQETFLGLWVALKVIILRSLFDIEMLPEPSLKIRQLTV
jgi:hypothetical protein